jgi:mRNA interferase MazF
MSHLKSLQRGEIWLVDLGENQGAEMEKTRPVVVLTDDNTGVLPLRVVVPLTHWQDKFKEAPWLIRIEPTPEDGLDQISAADTFQVRSLSEERFYQKLGKMSSAQLQHISQSLKEVLGLS